MRMKIAMGFVQTLIIMKILVLSCALHINIDSIFYEYSIYDISKFCVVL